MSTSMIGTTHSQIKIIWNLLSKQRLSYTRQCYIYRTNIRHIPPEVAWKRDTTSVIRWVWYDASMHRHFMKN